ncbi:MAG: succinyl-diaminopimelate desuccinylase [Actinomycetota bacterium]|nr:succinyl-diaminopimelate desuccinylase [Actinomycetota bacterium]
MTDLLALTAELVDIPSVSLDERAIADHIEAALRDVEWLQVTRVGDNVVARTDLGRAERLLLVGHIDTVPVNGNDRARIDDDVLWGLGSCDMKGGCAVFLELARTVSEPSVDVSYVFYTAEEIAAEHNGLLRLFRERPELMAGDAAILGEPTEAAIEAGCQGTLQARVTYRGERAHTARPWMGVNAIHRMGSLLASLDAYEARRPVIDGCEFREALQAVHVDGGVAGNVVPDRASVSLNHRFAPDRSGDEAAAHVRSLVELADGDTFELLDVAPGAPPALEHPLLARLARGREVRAKLGWTDVARMHEHGVPACNFGPGDPSIAHTRDEHVRRAEIEAVHAALLDVLTH